MGAFIMLYLILHSPAIIMLVLGLSRLKTKPNNAKVLLILATVYFIVGGGICLSMMRGFR